MAKGKTMPAKMIPRVCGHCGGTGRVYNGAWLRYHRELHGVGLRELARWAEVSACYVSDVERNNRHVSQKMLAAYVKYVGIKLPEVNPNAR